MRGIVDAQNSIAFETVTKEIAKNRAKMATPASGSFDLRFPISDSRRTPIPRVYLKINFSETDSSMADEIASQKRPKPETGTKWRLASGFAAFQTPIQSPVKRDGNGGS